MRNAINVISSLLLAWLWAILGWRQTIPDPDATHSIEALGDKPAVTFSSYGETHHSKRFEFDPVTYTAKNF
jgi:predicted metal-dependent enzyme (double-stranded beta helix superfamily)